MKRFICLVIITLITIGMCACGDTKKSDDTSKTESTTKSADTLKTEGTTKSSDTSKAKGTTKSAGTKEIATVSEYVTALKSSVTISFETKKAAEMIGAVDGMGFTVNGKVFELYLFEDEKKINEAKSGKFTFTIEGYGKITMKSTVNGKFVLLYNEADSSVINAFTSVK